MQKCIKIYGEKAVNDAVDKLSDFWGEDIWFWKPEDVYLHIINQIFSL